MFHPFHMNVIPPYKRGIIPNQLYMSLFSLCVLFWNLHWCVILKDLIFIIWNVADQRCVGQIMQRQEYIGKVLEANQGGHHDCWPEQASELEEGTRFKSNCEYRCVTKLGHYHYIQASWTLEQNKNIWIILLYCRIYAFEKKNGFLMNETLGQNFLEENFDSQFASHSQGTIAIKSTYPKFLVA
jgi:hypothetical protein